MAATRRRGPCATGDRRPRRAGRRRAATRGELARASSPGGSTRRQRTVGRDATMRPGRRRRRAAAVTAPRRPATRRSTARSPRPAVRRVPGPSADRADAAVRPDLAARGGVAEHEAAAGKRGEAVTHPVSSATVVITPAGSPSGSRAWRRRSGSRRRATSSRSSTVTWASIAGPPSPRRPPAGAGGEVASVLAGRRCPPARSPDQTRRTTGNRRGGGPVRAAPRSSRWSARRHGSPACPRARGPARRFRQPCREVSFRLARSRSPPGRARSPAGRADHARNFTCGVGRAIGEPP